MNKFKYFVAISSILISGCTSILDTDNLVKKDTSNFPSNEIDAEQMITGIYASYINGLNYPETDPFFVFELAGDDRLGGGSTSNKGSQCLDRFMNSNTSNFENMWGVRYSGIFRANTAIGSLDKVTEWTTDEKRSQLIGEAHFLRAYFYLDLVQLFGEIPLVLTPEAQNLPKSPADDIYAQIAYDLLTAIENFPSLKYPDYGDGHASKWSAEALLARAFMFYTGFYEKSDMPVAGSDKKVTKEMVINYLEDCINNSGNGLVSDQRNLWPYTNPYTAKSYNYAKNNDLVWEGDENKEVMFAIKMSNTSDFSNIVHNRIVEFFNPRKTTPDAFPFVAQGYSNGPVCSKLWTDWVSDPDYAGDYRRKGSICDRAVELPKYPGDKNKEVENTGLFAKKYLGCGAYDEGDANSTLRSSYSFFYGGQDDKQLGLTQSLILIRFADVLLMHSELTNGKVVSQGLSGMNLVRKRANLPAVPYSLEALKKERRYELCFEALRWNDLRRWGDVENIVKNQVGNPILNKGKSDLYKFDSNFDFMTRYKETGGGFFKIPESQVTLSDGVLKQNPGWESKYDWVKLPYSTI